IEVNRRLGNLARQLPQRADVIQDPKGAAVRADDQVGAVDRQVAHRGVRQVELKRLPMVAVVERDMYCSLSAREKKATAEGVLPDGVDRRIVRQPFDGLPPAPSAIAGPVDVWLEIV